MINTDTWFYSYVTLKTVKSITTDTVMMAIPTTNDNNNTHKVTTYCIWIVIILLVLVIGAETLLLIPVTFTDIGHTLITEIRFF